jgi:hypothetical protein
MDNFRDYDEFVFNKVYAVLSTIKYEAIDKFIENYVTLNRGAPYTYDIRPVDNERCSILIKFY